MRCRIGVGRRALARMRSGLGVARRMLRRLQGLLGVRRRLACLLLLGLGLAQGFLEGLKRAGGFIARLLDRETAGIVIGIRRYDLVGERHGIVRSYGGMLTGIRSGRTEVVGDDEGGAVEGGRGRLVGCRRGHGEVRCARAGLAGAVARVCCWRAGLIARRLVRGGRRRREAGEMDGWVVADLVQLRISRLQGGQLGHGCPSREVPTDSVFRFDRRFNALGRG